MWERSPQAMQVALARHDEILKQAIEERGGYVFKTVGDAFCCAFWTATDALDAALEVQRRSLTRSGKDRPLEGEDGTAHRRCGRARGTTSAPVNRVARLLPAGHGASAALAAYPGVGARSAPWARA